MAVSLVEEANAPTMHNNEDVNDYCHREEKLYYQLCTASTLGKIDTEAKIIHETLKEQTLANFIKGLVEPIRTIVKSRNPKTLEMSKQLSKAKEVEYNTERDNYRHRNENSNNRGSFSRNNSNNYQRTTNTNYNNRNNGNFRSNNFTKPNNFTRTNNYQRTDNFTQPNNTNRPVIKCYNCNGNHYASQCRNNPRTNYSNNSSNNRPPNRNNFTQLPTNYNIQVATCTYCNRNGHNINACYKKRNDESRHDNNSGNANVSNEGRGTRSINQIIAEQPMHDATTSLQL
ncbi:glycosyltransferase-like protein gnt13 [Metopolophium dirhodum]|uniref:glycosyltransferase-like protein gnt13 n=1 Tax=Metopolophium dirhodum TaxID=44670 RepID=UPI00298F4FF5|nr:glycosyltransferase-like protein gnt13 [Metopolophium dirhodum]